jgi:hypothetical protein
MDLLKFLVVSIGFPLGLYLLAVFAMAMIQLMRKTWDYAVFAAQLLILASVAWYASILLLKADTIHAATWKNMMLTVWNAFYEFVLG